MALFELKSSLEFYIIEIKNLKTKKKSKKLDLVKIDLFFIKKIKESKSYELNLSKDIKICLVFNILLLERVDLSTSIQNTFHYESQEEDEFEVEQILDQRD